MEAKFHYNNETLSLDIDNYPTIDILSINPSNSIIPKFLTGEAKWLPITIKNLNTEYKTLNFDEIELEILGKDKCFILVDGYVDNFDKHEIVYKYAKFK